MNVHDCTLKEISFQTFEEIRKNVELNISDMINTLSVRFGKGPQDITLRRRIYDAINVLEATGIIEKTKTRVKWIGGPKVNIPKTIRGESADLEKAYMRTFDKVAKLKYKMNMLTLYNAIISRNCFLPRPSKAIPLRFIIFQADNMSYQRTNNGMNIRIINHNAKPPQLYTPFEVLNKIDFRFDVDAELTKKYPALVKANELIDLADNVDEDDD